jgi:hypothetical protein
MSIVGRVEKRGRDENGLEGGERILENDGEERSFSLS